jgi:hypothetical protein
MKKRTQDEINRQIEGLKKMKNWLPERSKFGTPNWERIDAQISVLSGNEDMDDFEENAELLEEGEPDEIYNAAQEASDWLDGDNNDDLFEER